MSWKKVVVSGSNAHLSTIGVGTAAAPSTAGHISASGKLFTATSNSNGGLSSFDVVIKGANGEFMHTASSAINPSLENLTISTGLKPSGDYNGSSPTTISVDSGSLAGNGLAALAAADGIGFKVSTGTNLIADSNGLRVKTGSLAGFGLTADPLFTSGSTALGTGKLAINVDKSTINFNNSGQLTVLGGSAANALTNGNGIQSFSYDGGTAGVTVVVDTGSLAGIGLTGTLGDNGYAANKISITGSTSFASSTNTVLKWTGDAFAPTNITDDGSTITLGDGTYTTSIPGNLTVAGTASFNNTSNTKTADDFIILNSGSENDVAFGILGQTGASTGTGWVYGGSTNKRFTMTKNADLTDGGEAGTKVGDATLLVNTNNVTTATSDTYMSQDGNMLVDATGNIYIHF